MDISHTLYSAYRCNRQPQTGKICVATLPTRALALPINYAIITTYAYNMHNKFKIKTSCLQPKHNCSTAVCTANKLPHTTVINRFNSQCTFICDTGSSNATFVLWQIQNILNWVSNVEHVCSQKQHWLTASTVRAWIFEILSMQHSILSTQSKNRQKDILRCVALRPLSSYSVMFGTVGDVLLCNATN